MFSPLHLKKWNCQLFLPPSLPSCFQSYASFKKLLFSSSYSLLNLWQFGILCLDSTEVANRSLVQSKGHWTICHAALLLFGIPPLSYVTQLISSRPSPGSLSSDSTNLTSLVFITNTSPALPLKVCCLHVHPQPLCFNLHTFVLMSSNGSKLSTTTQDFFSLWVPSPPLCKWDMLSNHTSTVLVFI